MKQQMQRRFFRILLVATCGILPVVHILSQAHQVALAPERNSTFHIDPLSSLTLEGTTNVNQFSCKCTESFPAQEFFVTRTKDEKCTNVFRQTRLKLSVKSLDCGNRMMNRDMYGALNADDFPYIYIDLLQVAEELCDLPGEEMNWAKLIAVTRITINGQSHDYWMNVIARKTGPGQFRFISEKVLSMKDFGIDPPTAALGMVKVRDEIKISLDMQVTVN